MYTRGSASDYDDWAHKYHSLGWDSAALLPLLQKVSHTSNSMFDADLVLVVSQRHFKPCQTSLPTDTRVQLRFHTEEQRQMWGMISLKSLPNTTSGGHSLTTRMDYIHVMLMGYFISSFFVDRVVDFCITAMAEVCREQFSPVEG